MNQPKPNFFALVGIVLGLIVVSAAQAGEPMIKPEAVPAYQPKHFPFESGEKEIYRVTWNGMVSVATAEVQTVPTVVDGQKGLSGARRSQELAGPGSDLEDAGHD